MSGSDSDFTVMPHSCLSTLYPSSACDQNSDARSASLQSMMMQFSFPIIVPQFLHELVAAHDTRRLLVHDHVDAGWLARSEGALDGTPDVVGLRDVFAMSAHPLDDLVVAAVVAEHAVTSVLPPAAQWRLRLPLGIPASG